MGGAGRLSGFGDKQISSAPTSPKSLLVLQAMRSIRTGGASRRVKTESAPDAVPGVTPADRRLASKLLGWYGDNDYPRAVCRPLPRATGRPRISVESGSGISG